MANYPELECTGNIVYYGNSDLLGQIADELNRHPDSCFSKNVKAWYDAEYSASEENLSCSYQVEINQDLCQGEPGDTLEDGIDALLAIVRGQPRRLARASVRIICREANRRIIENTSQRVE